MMLFKQKQLDVFNAIALKKYENDLIGYIKSNFRALASDQSEDELRSIIRHAIAKGKLYGFVSRKNVFLLLNIMLQHGVNFDFDESGDWAREVLNDKTIYSPDYRIGELIRRSKEIRSHSSNIKEQD